MKTKTEWYAPLRSQDFRLQLRTNAYPEVEEDGGGAEDERGVGGGRGDGRGRREHDSDGSDDEDRIPFGVSDGAKHNRNYQRLLRNFGIDAEENSAIKLAHLERYPINRFQHFRNPTNNPQVNRDIEEQLSW